MEEVQKLKNKLDDLGIQYHPVDELSLKDLVSRLENNIPAVVVSLLRTIGSFKINDSDYLMGLGISRSEVDIYLRYMVLTTKSGYSADELPLIRLGVDTYVTINVNTEQLSMVKLVDSKSQWSPVEKTLFELISEKM